MAIADTMQACKPMTVKTSKYAVDSYKVNAKHEIRKSRLALQVARLATTNSNPENKIIAIEALLSREAKKIGAKRNVYSTMKEEKKAFQELAPERLIYNDVCLMR